jgi:hypothetical protein
MKKIFLLIITFTSINFAQEIVDSYSESNYSADIQVGYSYYKWVGQSFLGNGDTLKTAKFYLSRDGTISGSAYAQLYAHSETFGLDGLPTGSVLVQSNGVAVSTIGTSHSLITFTFATPYILIKDTPYFIVLYYSSGGSSYINIGCDTFTPNHVGNCALDDGSWTVYSGGDACFYVYGQKPISVTTFVPIITID